MKRKFEPKALLMLVALLATLVSWGFMIGIVLYANVPSLIKWICGVYVFGTSTIYYLEKVKD